MSHAFEFWKTAHILSAAVLFGTGIGIAFFCWFGYRTALRSGEIGVLRSVLRFTVIADACLTVPAVIFQALSGIVLMRMLNWPVASRWSIAVWGLYLLIGACWLPVLVIQAQLKREAEQVSTIEALPAQFYRKFRWWFALGIPAFAAVVVIYYLMVAAPLALSVG